MPLRLSTILGKSRKAIEAKGVYDSTVDFDSKLHIDPALLRASTIPEFLESSDKVTKYFKDTIELLKTLKGRKSGVVWRTVLKRLTFGEGLNSGLGYSGTGTSGSGIGPEMAYRIAVTISEIIDSGITDPAMFELIPILEDGIGPDRISDMISIILQDEFRAFTKRISEELKVEIPANSKGERLVFIPKSILSNLPVVEQWEDVKVAAEYNEKVRGSFNSLIGKSWKQISKDLNKRELKEVLLSNPILLKDLISKYKLRPLKNYDFTIDHLGVLLWDIVGKKYAESDILDLSKFGDITQRNVLEVVIKICEQYRKLIENNGLVEHIYDSTGKRRPEKFAQLLFFAVADCYCTANNLDLSREISSGSGALDFKISSGKAKVTVEIKYSSNPKLVEGFEKQLPAYNKAEGVNDDFSIYLLLNVNDNQTVKIKSIHDLIAERKKRKQASPTFIVIDAVKKPSASKR